MESRWRIGFDGRAQGGGVVWRSGGVDGWLDEGLADFSLEDGSMVR